MRLGFAAYEDLAKAIEDMEGRKISPKTLINKAWVYKKTKDLNLPEDSGFGLRQQLAGLKEDSDRTKFTQMVLDGFPDSRVIALIRKFKGIEPKKKAVMCPKCGNKFES